MGYAYYERDGMERGYAVEDTCHHPGCDEKIDRGLAYLCHRCGLYFCPKHQDSAWDASDEPIVFSDTFAGDGTQICKQCCEEVEAGQ